MAEYSLLERFESNEANSATLITESASETGTLKK